MPSVSVIIDVAGETPLSDASLRSLEAQTFSDFEAIVVSPAAAAAQGARRLQAVAGDARFRTLLVPDDAEYATRMNAAVAAASGEFVALHGAGDISLPKRLASQVRLFQDYPDIGLAGSAYFTMDAAGRDCAVYRKPIIDTTIRWHALFADPFCHTSIMFRRELCERYDLQWTDEFPGAEDYDLWCRMLQGTHGANIGLPLVRCRGESAEQQMSNADIGDALSLREIHRIGGRLQVARRDVPRLRRLFFALPDSLSLDDMAACRCLLQLLRRLARSTPADRYFVKRMADNLVTNILRRVPVARLGGLVRTGLCQVAVTMAPGAVWRDVVARLSRRFETARRCEPSQSWTR